MLRHLSEAVDRAAARAPDREAVRCMGKGLSYEALAQGARRLANALQSRGVVRGDRVAVYAPKGLRATQAIHGIMTAGAAYVPLDPSAPPERLRFILEDCDIRHLVTEPAFQERIQALIHCGAAIDSVIGLDVDSVDVEITPWDVVDSVPGRHLDPALTEDDLSYVLYTSGSTGVPKGVAHTHRSALAWAEIAATTYGFGPLDRVSNHAPLHFDLSTLDYFAVAVAGATTVVIPETHIKLPASFTKLIEHERLTVLYTVPLALTHVLLHGACEKRDLSSVRWVLFGGEPFPTKYLRALMTLLPGARFSNVYGPTEVNGVTYWIVPELEPESDAPIPIGRPYDGVRASVMSEQGVSVPLGEPGELWVETPTMMRGYWNRPDLDERVFVRRAGRTFVRTGDLVRAEDDGTLHFLGRRDRQVKIRGHRVELDEVEAVITTHEAVETAAAFLTAGPGGAQRLEAAVTLREGASAEPAALKAHAARSLPAYAVPGSVTVLAEMPLTSTGKIDRLRLKTLLSRDQGRVMA